jgi:hypothetical protein
MKIGTKVEVCIDNNYLPKGTVCTVTLVDRSDESFQINEEKYSDMWFWLHNTHNQAVTPWNIFKPYTIKLKEIK